MTTRALGRLVGRPGPLLWLGGGFFLLAALLGAVAGSAPVMALLALGALALGALLLVDLAIAVAAFTVLQFGALVQGVPAQQAALVRLTGAVLVLAWLMSLAGPIRMRTQGLVRHQPALAVALVAFLAWGGLSVLWAANGQLVTDTLSRYALNMVLLAIVFSAAARSRRGVVWIVVALGVGALLAAGGNALTAGDPEDEGRLAGALANELAQALVPGMLLLAAIAAWPIGRGRRLALGAVVALSAVALFGTLSRGGIVALALALLAWTVFGGRWRPQLAALCGSVVLVAVVYFGLVASPEARERVTSFTGETALSTEGGSGRTDLWEVGWRVAEANPVLGVGLGNFTEATPHHLAEAGLVRRSDLVLETPKAAHNTYLEVLAEGGAPSAALFAAILALALVATARAARAFQRGGDRPMELLSRALFAGTVGVLAANVFISGQHERVLWILLGLGPALLALARRSSSSAGHGASS